MTPCSRSWSEQEITTHARTLNAGKRERRQSFNALTFTPAGIRLRGGTRRTLRPFASSVTWIGTLTLLRRVSWR
uniref:Uncharacterized protein n=1 Tax=uncultured marine virus TaxID=186617 RepID=A0A0F7L5Y1_9VIRU|nr:hypothetical protein [uncultured marine virus]